MTSHLNARDTLFLVLAAGISGTALVLSGILPSLERPSAVALGITLDLTLIIPAAYYFLVVRPRAWPVAALAPVVVLSLLAAAAILPSDYQQTLRWVEAVAIPVEAGLLGWIGWQAAQALRQVRHGASADPLVTLHRSARDLLRMDRVADVLASELAVLYYAFGAWRTPPHIPEGTRPFSSHRRSGHGGLVFGLLVVTAAEGVVVHLLLAGWSTTIAWIITFLSLYGALWLVADYRATVLRPILSSDGEVWVRAGLRWHARIPRRRILRVTPRRPATDGGARSLAFLTTPNLWIELSAPVLLEGPYGLRREAGCLGLFVDDAAGLQRILTEDAG